MRIPDKSAMGLPDLLVYEAALRDLQARYWRDRIFDALTARAEPKPPSTDKNTPTVTGPSTIDKTNARLPTQAETAFLDARLAMIRSGVRNGDDQSGLLSRYRRTLPRQAAATSEDHPVTVHLREAIAIMERPR